MSVFLTDIFPEIYDSLEFRQNNITNRSKIGWFQDKTAWVRMTSMAKINNDENIRKEWVLQGLNDKNAGGIQLYGSNNRPLPGITNAEIANKGTMGSIREAQVSFVCWDLEQLQMLEMLFMTPGVSILLEWGWNKDIYGNTITQNMSAAGPMYDTCAAIDARKRTKDSAGHYDAMQGLITNFNWSARDDGGFDCSTTFSSMSELYLTTSIKSKSKNILRRGVKAEENQPASFEENILATIFEVIDLMDMTDGGKLYEQSEVVGCKIPIDAKGEGGSGHDELLKVRRDRLDKGWFGSTFLGNPWEWIGLRDNWLGDQFGNEDNYFITWDFFERIIVNANLSMIPEDKPPCKYVDEEGITYSPYVTSLEKELLPTLSNYDTKINYRKNIISSDPYVCILPQKIISGDSESSYYDIPPELVKDFPNGNENKINLSDILINLKLIVGSYKNSETLNDFVLQILNAISDSCGGLWQFNLHVDEDNPTKVMVVDHLTVEQDDPKPFKFKYYHTNCILTSYSLNSEVNNDFKASIMYGVNKKRGGTNPTREKDTEGTTEYDFYGASVRNIVANELRSPEANEIGKFDTSGDPKEVANPNEPLNYDEYLNNAFNELFDKRTPDTVEDCQKALNKYITEVIFDSGEVIYDKRHLILPIKLSVGLEGIGGLKYGNLIDVDYKPDRYDGKVNFQITNVKQTISDGEWNTELETIMRVKPVGYVNYSPYVSALTEDEEKKTSIYGSNFTTLINK